MIKTHRWENKQTAKLTGCHIKGLAMGHVLEASSCDFESYVLHAESPVLVYLHSNVEWNCCVQERILQEFLRRSRAQIAAYKFDREQNPEILAQLRIATTPAVALFHNGSLIWKAEGIVPLPMLINALSLLSSPSLNEEMMDEKGGSSHANKENNTAA
jgi:thioredoxin-like negative regulator of GroEL